MRAQIWQGTSQEARGGFWGVLWGVAKGRWRPEGRVANGSYARSTVNQGRADLKNYYFGDIKALDDGIHGGPSYIR